MADLPPGRDPYAALKFREFQYFLVLRFALVFAWSMQFVVIESWTATTQGRGECARKSSG